MQLSRHGRTSKFFKTELALALGTALGCSSRAEMESGLAARFSFDETNGLIAFDSTTNHADRNVIQFPDDNSQWVVGHIKGCLNLDAGLGSP